MLVQPTDVYPGIRERSPVFWPMLLVGAMGIVSSLMVLPHIQEAAQRQLAADPNVPEAALDAVGTMVLWGAVGGGAVSPIVHASLTAAVISVAMLFTGGRLPYRQSLSLVLLSYGPLLLAGLVSASMVAAGLVETVTAAETSAALVLGPEAVGTWPYRILGLIDPFEWWHVWLLAGGISHLGDTRPQTAWGIAVLVWLVMYASVTILVQAPGV